MSNSPLTNRRLFVRLVVALIVTSLMLKNLISLQKVYDVQLFSDNTIIARKEKESEDDNAEEAKSESCLRPRRNGNVAAKSPLRPPFINLGMPKMGSTSLDSYFKCGGYNSVHWTCGGGRMCADCIVKGIKAGLPPFSKCNTTNVDAYAQMDRGPENLVQVNYLNEIVRGVPNATFILTFRNMTKWYISLTNWPPKQPENNMRMRFERANITGLPKGVGRNVSEFSSFYCEYVKRVREEVAKYPGSELIEIDIEDPLVGWQMEEVFGTNHTCWGDRNGGYTKNMTITEEELQR